MKKCPHCAEKIQDEAIVCRYCGRDLPSQAPKSSEPRATPPLSPASRRSFWSRGETKAAIIITALYAISQLVARRTVGATELLGSLTVGVVVTFFFWLLLCSGIAWLWRRVGAIAFIVGVLAVGITAVVTVLSRGGAPSEAAVAHPTGTPASIAARTQEVYAQYVPTWLAEDAATNTAQVSMTQTAAYAWYPNAAATAMARTGYKRDCVPWGSVLHGDTCIYGTALKASKERLWFDNSAYFVYLGGKFDVKAGDCVKVKGITRVGFFEASEITQC